MRRALLAGALAAGILVFSPSTAGAWFAYCDWDPVVLVITPTGHVVPVYDSVWTSSPLDLGLPLESYTTSRAYDAQGNPETAVDMTIYVPTGLLLRYSVNDMVTSGPLGSGSLYAARSGTSGTPVHLHFLLRQA